MSFEKWYYNVGYLGDDQNTRARIAFEAGQQSKQDEIDELKMSNHNLSIMTAEAESYSEYWKYERDKLQKRIEGALEYIEPSDNINHKAYRDFYKILKGDQS